jgi:hypothetical protein
MGAKIEAQCTYKRRLTMKIVISLGIALALMLSVAPAMAGDADTFQAFSKMVVGGEQELLTPLSDGQLATIEGQGSDYCTFCSQYAANYNATYQANVNYSWKSDVDQRNSNYTRQSIRQSIN